MSELLRRIARDPVSESGRDWEPALFAGAVVDRFELVRELGRGGFGLVWEAIDRRLGRRVAFKAVRRGAGDVGQERLQAEAEAAARLSHPNIVTLFDMGDASGRPYLVLELLRGETLSARLERGALPPAEAVRLALEIARGVAHAHGKGVVHRDLKPANVFLCDDGQVKVLDLGLAHALGHVRAQGGTPGYMAPEQARGAPEDERTDVFALGVILFRMLAGKQPFRDELELRGVREAPRLEVPGAPKLEELVARLLQKDPVRRPRDAGEVVRELEGIQPPSPEPVRVHRRSARTWMKIVAAGVALGLLLAGAYAALREVRRPHPAQRFVVAIGDAENETGDPELDPLTRLLSTSLEQSQEILVVPRGRLVDLARISGETGPIRLDERRARVAARKAGATRLLLSSVYRLGARYRVEVKAVPTEGDGALFSVREDADRKEALLETLDRLAADVRRELGVPGAGESQLLARSVRPSLLVWRHYTAGLDCVAENAFAGTFEGCLVEFDLALAKDPGFALAHYQRSRMLDLQGMPRAEQKEAIDAAMRDIARVPPSQRAEVRAWEAYLDGRELEAKELAREAAEASPDDKRLWWLAAEIPYRRDELAEAARLFARVNELDPTLVVPAVQLVYSLGATGDLPAVRRLISRLQAIPSRAETSIALCQAYLWVDRPRAVPACDDALHAGGGQVAEGYLALALYAAGDRPRLDELLRRMEAAEGPLSFAWFMRLHLDAQEGRWDEFARRAASPGEAEYGWLHAALAEGWLGKGDTERAWRSSQRALAVDPALAAHLAVHLAFAGDLAHADELARHLPVGSPRAELYLAVLRWRRGDLTGALPELERLTRASTMSTPPETPSSLFLLGEALAEAGRHAEASAALERFLALPLRHPTWQVSRALLDLARSREAIGDRAGARRATGLLLSIWRKATADQPFLAEARAMGARLGVDVR